MGQEGAKDRLDMVSREPTLGQEGAKDRLDMVSRERAKKVPRIDQTWFQESQLGQRRSQG